MKTIYFTCHYFEELEEFRKELSKKYISVWLISAPRFPNEGCYIFEVEEEDANNVILQNDK